MTNRQAKPEPGSAERRFARRTLMIVVRNCEDVVFMEDTERQFQLGFSHKDAISAKLDFARKLYNLSRTVAKQQPDKPDDPNLQKSLKLNEKVCRAHLHGLRKVGAGLQAKLKVELKNCFEYYGFLKKNVQEEPGLAFYDKEPILWEMMYEGSQIGNPDWRRFWGFRVPIAHWAGRGRTDQIHLRNGFFTAIDEELDFAGREVTILSQKLKQRLPHQSLKGAFQDCVSKDLRNQMRKDEKVASWWKACKPNNWLLRFLNERTNDQTERDIEKEKLLFNVLKDHLRCDLIHFACHCEAGENTEILSQLKMKVAGEMVCLSVSLISSDLKRESLSFEDPGPLVFLNACGTGQQSPSYEPPGLPDGWIKHQGALAVVVTLCPVPDYFAHAFALKFYEILFEFMNNPYNSKAGRNRYVSEALLETRCYFMEKYNNPLGLAYVLYAIKGVHVCSDFV